MLQTINTTNLKSKLDVIVNQTSQKKSRFLIRRQNKPLAVLIPLEDAQWLLEEKETVIETYSADRVKEFLDNDILTPQQKKIAKHLLNE